MSEGERESKLKQTNQKIKNKKHPRFLE